MVTAGPRWRSVCAVVIAVCLSTVSLVPNRLLAQADACPEPNDDPASACSLANEAAVQSFIEQPGDLDVYRVDVACPGRIQLDLTDLPADYDLYLADASGGVIGQSAHEGTRRSSFNWRSRAGRTTCSCRPTRRARSTRRARTRCVSA